MLFLVRLLTILKERWWLLYLIPLLLLLGGVFIKSAGAATLFQQTNFSTSESDPSPNGWLGQIGRAHV